MSGWYDLATFGYDSAGNMTSVAGSLFGTHTLAYDDESRMTSVAYPSGGGSVTDAHQWNALGQRMRAVLDGTAYRYVYNGERVLEETNDSGAMVARYTAAGGSYFAPWLHVKRSTGESRFPMYDEIGSARGLIGSDGTVTDTYDMDTFGRPLATTGSTPNPYQYGAAWGYITDPNGFLQLGARYYWPEVGRFLQQDPAKDGGNWLAYVENRPTASIDPEGLKKRPCSDDD